MCLVQFSSVDDSVKRQRVDHFEGSTMQVALVDGSRKGLGNVINLM
jgi:hypothetical protein